MVKDKFPNGLRDAMDSAQIGVTALGRLIEENKQNVQRWRDGEQRLKPEMASKIAPHVQATVNQLLLIEAPAKANDTLPALRTVMVAAHVQAGYWAETWEWEDDQQYPVAVQALPALNGFRLYAAETKGPSMNRRWPEGTVVVFTNVEETKESPVAGKRYVVERRKIGSDAEHTVKLLYRDPDGKFWLIPESDDPLHQSAISVEDGGDDDEIIKIVGRVWFAVTRE